MSGRLWSCPLRHTSDRPPRISVFLDIAQGAGLAGASGVRPFLPPLLAGALARGDLGIDFDDTGFAFLESPAFLAAVLALAVAAYVIERARGGAKAGGPDSARAEPRRRDPVLGLFAALSLALGALLFAGSLAEGNSLAWPGLLAGAACAALGFAAATAVFGGARRRLDAGAAALVGVYADVLALVVAGLSILFPPLALLALALFVFLLVRSRRAQERKFEGLRMLR